MKGARKVFGGARKLKGARKSKGVFIFVKIIALVLFHDYQMIVVSKYIVSLKYRAIGLKINIFFYNKAHLMGMKWPERKLFLMGDSLVSSCANHANRV